MDILRLLLIIILTISGFGLALSPVASQQYNPLLLNGAPTNAYLPAGYVLDIDGNQLGICGGTVLQRGIAVTAAHCVETGIDVLFGNGTISTTDEDNINITLVNVNPLWDGQDTSEDIAIIQYAEDDSDFEVANIVSPTAGCGYTVASYGQTSANDTGQIESRVKRSLPVCISELTSETFIITAETSGGFCFGDSGSPIFRTGTNDIVGIISAVRFFDATGDTTCELNNEVVSVRLDAKNAFLNQFLNDDVEDPAPPPDPEPDPEPTPAPTPQPQPQTPEQELPDTSIQNLDNSAFLLLGGVLILMLGITLNRNREV